MKLKILALSVFLALLAGHAHAQSGEKTESNLSDHRFDKEYRHQHRFRLWPWGHRHHGHHGRGRGHQRNHKHEEKSRDQSEGKS
jgi:hypothetical protein